MIQHFPEVLERYPIPRQRKKELEPAEERDEKFSREIELTNHQNCIIGELISMNRALTERVHLLENKHAIPQDDDQKSSSEQAAPAPVSDQDTVNKPKTCGNRALPKSPSAIWFEWYAKTPRLWHVCDDRQKKSAYKQIANYMKIFLPKGFELDPTEPGYCDETLRYGNEAEAQLIKVFESHGIKSKNGSSVLKQLCKFYREGKLDALISAYRVRVANEDVRDPTPPHTQELFSHS
ncbi:hypothetical protein PHMEG_00024043 [Phytophthora megakarya]|uniref:Uncharacterized protein n=1 Tax=Phytophthora megakarya TaxID=4795 RepID=A0A225VGL0_9STRA|nr:hypothetical protein PHMEG_00024043 [Phytophthora megakarya]